MYDIIRYIKKHNKLDYKIATTIISLEGELNEGKISDKFDKKVENVHKMQLDYINVCQTITEFLSQDENILHGKRTKLCIFNILISLIPAILSFKCVGVYKIVALVFAALVFGGNIIANKALSSIIDHKDETIEILFEGVSLRNQQLEELRNKYANFIGLEIRKIIEESNIDIGNDKKASEKVMNILKTKNIGGIEELTFFETKKENTPHNKDNNEFVFSTDDINEEIKESELISDKPKVKKRIRRDGDK